MSGSNCTTSKRDTAVAPTCRVRLYFHFGCLLSACDPPNSKLQKGPSDSYMPASGFRAQKGEALRNVFKPKSSILSASNLGPRAAPEDAFQVRSFPLPVKGALLRGFL